MERVKSLAYQKMEFRLHDELTAMLRRWGVTPPDTATLILSDEPTAALLMEMFDEGEGETTQGDLLKLALARLADLIYTSQKLRDTLHVANRTAKRRRAMYLAAKGRAEATVERYSRHSAGSDLHSSMVEEVRAIFEPPKED